jgi:arylsulfatase A-like enzyme
MLDCHTSLPVAASRRTRSTEATSTWSPLTEHVDLLPTILDLLDLEADWGVHGESLLPIVRGERRKEAVFADGGHEREMWGRFNFSRVDRSGRRRELCSEQLTYRDCPETMARTKRARADRWKLVMRLAGGNDLYDLARDPYELNNLWGAREADPRLAKAVLDLQQRMIDWCLRTDTDRPCQENVGA